MVVLLAGYEESGVLAYAMAIGNIFLPIATFNLRTYQISDTKGAYAQGSYLAFRCITVALAFSICIPYMLLTTESPAMIVPVLLYMLFKMDEAFCDTLSGIHQLGGRMDYIGVSQFTRGVLLVCSFGVTLLVAHDLSFAIFAMFASCLCMTVFYDFPHALRFGDLDFRISLEETKCLIKTCIPIALIALMLSGGASYARMIFGNTFGAEELGYFAAVAAPIVLIQAAARYFYSPVLVPLAEAVNKNDLAAFGHLLKRTTMAIMAIMVLLTVGLAIGSPIMFKLLYGEEIIQYISIVYSMMLATGLTTFACFYSDCLVICRDISGALVSVLVGLIFCLISVSGFEAWFYMDGINYSVALMMGAVVLLSLVRLKKSGLCVSDKKE